MEFSIKTCQATTVPLSVNGSLTECTMYILKYEKSPDTKKHALRPFYSLDLKIGMCNL